MKEPKKGREIHARAERAREKEQDFEKSLDLCNQAYKIYMKDKDFLGAAEVLGSKALVLKQLHRKTGRDKYLEDAIEIAREAVDIGKKANDQSALVMPYKNLGKMLKDAHRYEEAVNALQKSLDIMREHAPKRHNRVGVLSEIKAHLGFCQYEAGDKERGRQNMDEAINELKGNEEELKYNRDVWLSGAYMMFATALKNDDSDEAKSSLEKAREIIQSNKELVLRREQLEKLENDFNGKA